MSAAAPPAIAAVAREDITVLDADGLGYTRYRTLRSDRSEPSVLDLGAETAADDSLFIVPRDYETTRLDDGRTRLRFDGGSYAIMNTGRLKREIETADNGDLVFSSGDGGTGTDGQPGLWTAPGGFSSFAYSWIVPANIEIVDYRANRAGEWQQRGGTLSWRGERVNDVAFTIRYRVKETGDSGTTTPEATRQAPRPEPAATTPPPLTEHQRMRALTRGRPEEANPPERATAPLALQTAPANTLNFLPPASEPKQGPHSLQLERVVTLDTDGRPMITDRGDRVLEELARALAGGNARRVRITGPAIEDTRDTGGSAAMAARVADYLTAHDVADDKISTRAGAIEGPGSTRSIRITVEPGYVITGFASEN